MLKSRGFTLIELMITVAIVAILAAVAIPNYADHVRRGKISDAISGLSDQRLKMEQFYQDKRTYVGACGAQPTVAPAPAATANFSFDCGVPTALTYTITATGLGSMAPAVYSIDQAGVRRTVTPLAGWTAPATDCWALKKDGSC